MIILLSAIVTLTAFEIVMTFSPILDIKLPKTK